MRVNSALTTKQRVVRWAKTSPANLLKKNTKRICRRRVTPRDVFDYMGRRFKKKKNNRPENPPAQVFGGHVGRPRRPVQERRATSRVPAGRG